MEKIKNLDELPALFDIPLLCRLIGAQENAVRNYIRKGMIPYLQIGGKRGGIRFKKEDILEWIEKCRVV